MQIQLHAAQSKFLQSKALYRAFVGGIGSGKSWAGSYDLIKRAKPGRLYMVVAPTFGMLSDSTMRSFLAVAQQLGVVNMSAVKRAAPPTVKLRTGAEILFRSGDDPSHLYGPNLSGIWLDEASLMPIEVFNVGIGRLREAGQQGWLTATFTPKGRQHWTHEVFNTGRANTSIEFSRTRDNPFLPAEFAANVAQQYTSALALQELEGQFMDAEGALFKRGWFGIVATAPKIVRQVRAWDLAATPKDERRAHDPDWTVGVLMGKARDGTAYVLDIKRLRGTPQTVEAAIKQTAQNWLDGKDTTIWLEQEPGSAGVTVVDHYARVLRGYSFRSERASGAKATRAMPFAASAERGMVKLVAGHWVKDFLDEIEVFPYGAHDDQVDAASLAFNKLAARKDLWLRMDGETLDTRPEAADDRWNEYPKIVSGPTSRVNYRIEETATGRQTILYAPDEREIDIRPDAPGWYGR
jgi:predicted phage terminase large subunit-like protein